MSRCIPSETRIAIIYGSNEAAHSILGAIEPDNARAPEGIIIETQLEGSTLMILIRSSLGLGSLISTLDDLLSCVQAAEAALKQI